MLTHSTEVWSTKSSTLLAPYLSTDATAQGLPALALRIPPIA